MISLFAELSFSIVFAKFFKTLQQVERDEILECGWNDSVTSLSKRENNNYVTLYYRFTL